MKKRPELASRAVNTAVVSFEMILRFQKLVVLPWIRYGMEWNGMGWERFT
jgi:hypothetical protein